jgi:aminoglycoside phosphotransferase (APT) family kinase protein
MADSHNNMRFEQLVQRLYPLGRLINAWELKGGVSAQITALEVLLPGEQVMRMVVRRHGSRDLARNPQVAADEYRLLKLLKYEQMESPAPYYLDKSCSVFTAPYIVIEFIDGVVEFSPADLSNYLQQMATSLARIHSIACSKHDLSFLPLQVQLVAEKLANKPTILDESLDEGIIREALQVSWPLTRNEDAILHGDFWPGNTLWKNGKLVAVIDWEDAACGDPLSDLANARLEILWAFGEDAMSEFTSQYAAMMPMIDMSCLHFWDLWAALRPASRLSEWGLSTASESVVRERHNLFVSRALEGITGVPRPGKQA